MTPREKRELVRRLDECAKGHASTLEALGKITATLIAQSRSIDELLLQRKAVKR